MRAIRSALLTLAALGASAALAADWPAWRGPEQNGTSPETGLISSWSAAGENLIWRVDFVGRSTPVVFDGKVCANGRAGEGITRQEMVACFDAETGERLWEKRFNVYHSSVPWTRVGWANLVADPETGYLYAQGVGGLFFCFDSDTGDVVWSRRLIEEFGFMEGYGGRTQTPTLDEDRVIVSFSNTSWGSEARPLHRYRAFDKRTGELLWVSSPAPSQADKNTQSTPVVAVIGGRRLIVAGNGGGGIYALEARTGEPVWGFQLSQRGINTTVVAAGERVYAAHSEENIDEPTMGRVVAIDATGSGDVTATHELWRAPLGVGFSSPALAGGRLYAVDNAANLHVLDAATGRPLWKLDLGRVGKGSPVVADGKLYVTEVNGSFLIVEPGETAGRILDREEIRTPDRRRAEIYGSPAIAYGRIYFTTDEGLYCLGDRNRPFEATASAARSLSEEPPPPDAAPARLRIHPAELIARPGETIRFRTKAFDDRGRALGERPAEWSLESLEGELAEPGVLLVDPEAGPHAGLVRARAGELEALARVRVLTDLPLREDFESAAPGGRPSYLMGYVGRFAVEELEGGKVLAKGPSPVQIDRHITFLGRPDLSDYTIGGDLRASDEEGVLPDMGLINSGYTLELLGVHQKLQVRSWQSGLRMMREIDFPWQPGVWYAMALRVEARQGVGRISGKVWPRDGEEPQEWSIVAEDPLPIESGAPGLSAYTPSPVYFDNIKVTSNR